MAEEEEEEEGAESEEEPPKKSRLNQFVVLAAVVLLGQSVLAWFLVTQQIQPRVLSEEDAEILQSATVERQEVEIKPPLLFPVQDILVNPVDDAAVRFLNVSVTLELDTEEALMELLAEDKVLAAKLRDFLFRYFNSMPYYKMDDYEDRISLRKEIRDRLNEQAFLSEGEISAVYFKRFVLQ